MTLNAQPDLTEAQKAIVGALVTENCCLQLDLASNLYQLQHQGLPLGYALSAAEVAQLLAQGLVSKVETITLTPAGKVWATDHRPG